MQSRFYATDICALLTRVYGEKCISQMEKVEWVEKFDTMRMNVCGCVCVCLFWAPIAPDVCRW